MNKAQRITKWFIAMTCITIGKAGLFFAIFNDNSLRMTILVFSAIILLTGLYKLAYIIDYAIIQNATYRINANNNFKRYEKSSYTPNYTQN